MPAVNGLSTEVPSTAMESIGRSMASRLALLGLGRQNLPWRHFIYPL
jgi:hypothetical protein